MSGKVINLRRARKSQARAQKAQDANARAALFGRTKSERLSEETARQKAEATLEGHRRVPPGDDPNEA